jgi:hypothetical protein
MSISDAYVAVMGAPSKSSNAWEKRHRMSISDACVALKGAASRPSNAQEKRQRMSMGVQHTHVLIL